jgi:hypothetical protein
VEDSAVGNDRDAVLGLLAFVVAVFVAIGRPSGALGADQPPDLDQRGAPSQAE